MGLCWRVPALLISAMTLAGCGVFGGKDLGEPPAELVDFSATVELQRAWQASTGGGGDRLRLGLAPASDGARVYAGGHDGRVIAIDAREGNRVWQVNTRMNLAGGPAVSGDLVVFGTLDGHVLALDSATGEERWRVFVGGEVLTAPAGSSRAIVVRTVDGRLIALAPLDGRRLWASDHSVPRLILRGNAPPVISGNTVIAAFDSGRLGAYALANGDTLWEQQLAVPAGRTELERLVDINAPPLAIGRDLFVVGFQGNMVSLALESGQVIWAREFSSHGGLAADLNNLYVADAASEVLAVSRRNGNSVWLNSDMRMRDLTTPVALGDSVVFGDFEGYLHWLSAADGSFQARVRAGNRRVLGLTTVADLVVAQLDDGRVVAYRVRRDD
ncbi:MAG: outer membrane protein assembly factor BamB [Gammaproteobacteria bacterium]|nr:outer membrane protein assembly factor BamB [Gammaproteobacteria bacterium]